MPAQLVPPIELLGVTGEQPVHAQAQIAARRLNHQMKVIAHQHKGMRLPSRSHTRSPQQLKKK